MQGYLVLGPESTGTRLWTRVLMACGCYGDGGHSQRMDRLEVPAGATRVVWRRSMPHALNWDDIPLMARLLRDLGYEVQGLVCVRDWWSTVCSQVKQRYVLDVEGAEAHVQRAYRYILDGLAEARVPYVMGSYESLVARGAVMLGPLLGRLGLELPEGGLPELYDGNEPYYRAAKDG